MDRVAPNRLSVRPTSPYYQPQANAGLVVYLNDRKRKNVVEYSVSGKWIIIELLDGTGNAKLERGKVQTITLFGNVRAEYEDQV